MVQYLPLKPMNWPQDTFQIPAAMADMMPPTGRVNRDITQQESTILTQAFLGYNPLANTVTQVIKPTDQDGDFWCDQIFVMGYNVSDGLPNLGANTLGIADVRTGRSLTFGAADPPLEFWRNSFIFGDPFPPVTGLGGLPWPTLYRDTGTLPQPFCFTRQGGIQITLTNIGQEPAIDLYIVFAGWKEYSYGA